MDSIVFSFATGFPAVTMVLAIWFISRIRQEKRMPTGQEIAIVAGLAVLFVGGIFFLINESRYRFFYESTVSYGHPRIQERWVYRHIIPNQTGYRDTVPAYFHAIPKAWRRFTFLGDSVTLGHGLTVDELEKRFTHVIRADVNRGEAEKWEIHVFARSGFTTGDEIQAIKDAVARGYDLDQVVLVYSLNDIIDMSPSLGVKFARAMQAVTPRNAFVRNSYYLDFKYYRNQLERTGLFDEFEKGVMTAYEGDAWEAQQERLVELQELIEENGGTLLVVIFPYVHALGPQSPAAAAYAAIDKFWTARGVPHLDLFPEFKDLNRDDLVLNPLDIHPNLHANDIAAKAIQPFLKANLKPRPEKPKPVEDATAPGGAAPETEDPGADTAPEKSAPSAAGSAESGVGWRTRPVR